MTDHLAGGFCHRCAHAAEDHQTTDAGTVCSVDGCYCGRNPLEWAPVTKCEWCTDSASVVWARTKNGKAIPIEPEPNPAGNVEIIYDPARGGAPLAIVHGSAPGMFDDWTPFMPHHATCNRKLVNPQRGS